MSSRLLGLTIGTPDPRTVAPLVWDQHEETAIQSPDGGTKIAWGGPPVEPHRGRDRERLALATARDRLDDEVDRLIALGATTDDRSGDTVVLFDPDRNEFSLSAE